MGQFNDANLQDRFEKGLSLEMQCGAGHGSSLKSIAFSALPFPAGLPFD
ncbi:MAG: hypothetical protein AB7K24_16935 [Gemmataceae bacterium]